MKQVVFISYRRDDRLSKGVAGRIYESLEKKFGKGCVFIDFDDITSGKDFREKLRTSVSTASVILCLIGDEWSAIMSERKDDDIDYVRFELETALSLNKLIIPVQIDDGKLPDESELPNSLRSTLPYLNAFSLSTGSSYKNDIDKLIKRIKTDGGEPKDSSKRLRKILITLLTVFVISLFMALNVSRSNRMLNDSIRYVEGEIKYAAENIKYHEGEILLIDDSGNIRHSGHSWVNRTGTAETRFHISNLDLSKAEVPESDDCGVMIPFIDPSKVEYYFNGSKENERKGDDHWWISAPHSANKMINSLRIIQDACN